MTSIAIADRPYLWVRILIAFLPQQLKKQLFFYFQACFCLIPPIPMSKVIPIFSKSLTSQFCMATKAVAIGYRIWGISQALQRNNLKGSFLSLLLELSLFVDSLWLFKGALSPQVVKFHSNHIHIKYSIKYIYSTYTAILICIYIYFQLFMLFQVYEGLLACECICTAYILGS